MRLLLDSHAYLWWVTDHGALGSSAHQAITEAAEVFVSVVTPWELGLKRSLGKLSFPDDLFDSLEAEGMQSLAISLGHAIAAPQLPPHHRDPFDRMLIAQARLEALTIVTADAVFDDYDIDRLDARL